MIPPMKKTTRNYGWEIFSSLLYFLHIHIFLICISIWTFKLTTESSWLDLSCYSSSEETQFWKSRFDEDIIISNNQFHEIFGFGINNYVLIYKLAAILDEEEFGVAATDVEYDDKPLNSAEELGLLVSNQNDIIWN